MEHLPLKIDWRRTRIWSVEWMEEISSRRRVATMNSQSIQEIKEIIFRNSKESQVLDHFKCPT